MIFSTINSSNIYGFYINMMRYTSTTAKNTIKSLISLSEFKSIRNNNPQILTVEITKQPSILFTNSLWVGYRNGGMASWLSSLMPHLPHSKFCVYMDQDSYKGSQYMLSYYSQYFEKLFHNQYVGTFVHPRKLLNNRELTTLNEIKAKDLQKRLTNNKSLTPTVFLDLRGSDASTKCQMNKLVESYSNCEYINLPLNDEDLIDTMEMKTKHLEKGTKIITLCQKGYRSLIGYSFLNLVKKHEWDIQLCRDPINQIKIQLSKPIQVRGKETASFGLGLRSTSSLAYL